MRGEQAAPIEQVAAGRRGDPAVLASRSGRARGHTESSGLRRCWREAVPRLVCRGGQRRRQAAAGQSRAEQSRRSAVVVSGTELRRAGRQLSDSGSGREQGSICVGCTGRQASFSWGDADGGLGNAARETQRSREDFGEWHGAAMQEQAARPGACRHMTERSHSNHAQQAGQQRAGRRGAGQKKEGGAKGALTVARCWHAGGSDRILKGGCSPAGSRGREEADEKKDGENAAENQRRRERSTDPLCGSSGLFLSLARARTLSLSLSRRVSLASLFVAGSTEQHRTSSGERREGGGDLWRWGAGGRPCEFCNDWGGGGREGGRGGRGAAKERAVAAAAGRVRLAIGGNLQSRHGHLPASGACGRAPFSTPYLEELAAALHCAARRCTARQGSGFRPRNYSSALC